jgi:NADH-quinone oxidoreductase subunit J
MLILYVILVLGAVGLFFAVPGSRPALRRLGLLLTAAATAALLVGAGRLLTAHVSAPAFYLCALVAVLAAVRVITHTKPVYSALYFVLLVVAVAGLLVLLQAGFLAVALLWVYAGAILVTYIFVIMLAQQTRAAPYDVQARDPFWGLLGGFVLLGVIASQLLGGADAAQPAAGEYEGTVEAVGTLLLTQYVVAIQLGGVLLLAAMVGAIAIARRPAPAVGDEEDAAC